MKPVSFRIIVASALVWAVAAAASAQDRTQLLSSMEVKRLVASGSRTDHERLASHFAALADSYAAAAAHDEASAAIVPGNPTHPLWSAAVQQGSTARRLRDLERILRDLVTYHRSFAAGRSATLPEGAQQFQHGTGAPDPSPAQIRELTASARTTAEHLALAEYFAEQAEKLTAAGRKHAATAQMYRLRANDRGGSATALAQHCESEAAKFRAEAAQARSNAAEQRQAASRG